MKRIVLCLTLLVSACAAPQRAQVMLEAPIMEESTPREAAMAPVAALPCEASDVGPQDGIGGTGCNGPQVAP